MKKREITKEEYSKFMMKSIYSIENWLDSFQGTDKEFVKVFKIKKETYIKRHKNMTLYLDDIKRAIDILKIPTPLVGKIFFNEEPNERVKKQIEQLIDLSFNQYSKEGQEKNER